MRGIYIIKLILENICIICSIALLAVCVLDWYNPYMNFLGNSLFLLYILCICSVISGGIEIFAGQKVQARKTGKRH